MIKSPFLSSALVCAVFASVSVTTPALPLYPVTVNASDGFAVDLGQAEYLVRIDTSAAQQTSALISEFAVRRMAEFGMLDGTPTPTDLSGVTQLLSFTTSQAMTGLFVSELFANVTPLSTTIPGVQTAELVLYDHGGSQLLTTRIRGTSGGTLYIDFGAVVGNVNIITLSSGGVLQGLQSSSAAISAIIVSVPEPDLMWMYLIVLLAGFAYWQTTAAKKRILIR